MSNKQQVLAECLPVDYDFERLTFWLGDTYKGIRPTEYGVTVLCLRTNIIFVQLCDTYNGTLVAEYGGTVNYSSVLLTFLHAARGHVQGHPAAEYGGTVYYCCSVLLTFLHAARGHVQRHPAGRVRWYHTAQPDDRCLFTAP